MGIAAAIKSFFGALGALMGFLDRRAVRRGAKSEVYNEQDRETLELVKRVADMSVSDVDRVWSQLQKKRAAERNMSNYPEA
tara:strand:- start:4391 stop:4633 length:243 start_codon:yes stop_codon:yes gene_type:complete